MAPMSGELRARPAQPQVTANPVAVAVDCGKLEPTMASVVAKTGAMETPARKTRTAATAGRLVRSMKNVVTAMATAAHRMTLTGEP